MRDARTKRGISVPNAAALLGVSERTLQRWEGDRYEPALRFVEHMARLYKVTTDSLIRGSARAA